MFHARWFVCKYVSSGSFVVENALKLFDTARGATSNLSRHTVVHTKRNASKLDAVVPNKVGAGEKRRIEDVAALTVIQSMVHFNFAESPGMAAFARACFEVGQRTSAATHVDLTDVKPSARAVRESVSSCASRLNHEMADDMLKRSIIGGGGSPAMD